MTTAEAFSFQSGIGPPISGKLARATMVCQSRESGTLEKIQTHKFLYGWNSE